LSEPKPVYETSNRKLAQVFRLGGDDEVSTTLDRTCEDCGRPLTGLLTFENGYGWTLTQHRCTCKPDHFAKHEYWEKDAAEPKTNVIVEHTSDDYVGLGNVNGS